jgi:hypothetical protein
MTYDEVGNILSMLQTAGFRRDEMWEVVRLESSPFTVDDLAHVQAWLGPPPREEADDAAL